MKSTYKWIIGDKQRLGPYEVPVVAIPQIWADPVNQWYFTATHEAVPASRVFDTPQAAALATVAANEVKIQHLQMENARLMQWHKDLEDARERREAVEVVA